MLGTVGVLTGGAGALLFALDQSVRASELELHPPKNPWSHNGLLTSLDHARLVALVIIRFVKAVMSIGSNDEDIGWNLLVLNFSF